MLGPVSNISLLARIEAGAEAASRGGISPGELARILELNASNLEAVPRSVWEEAGSLAHNLQVAQWALDEDCVADLVPMLNQLQDWLVRARHAGA